jgi:hypothetical protein
MFGKIGKYLDPSDRLSEIMFGLIIAGYKVGSGNEYK